MPTPDLTEITLFYSRDNTTKTTYYTVAIPDSRLEGMSGPNLKTVIPQLWNSTRAKAERIHHLSVGVAQIEAYQPLGGPPPAPLRKVSRLTRLARFLNSLFWRKRK
jgi:hypothetical protein